MSSWSILKLGDQSNKTYIITGANSGLGYASAVHLAKKNAEIIMACRTVDKAESAINKIRKITDNGKLIPKAVELNDLKTVRKFAEIIGQEYAKIDVLMNNAGIMAVPKGVTRDGFEAQFGTNHLGHFVLTARLWSLLKESGDARVVSLSSIAAFKGKMKWNDLMHDTNYQPWTVYEQSKLANMLFGLELDKRSKEAVRKVKSIVAHPGVSPTNLFKGMKTNLIAKSLFNTVAPAILMNAEKACHSQVRAATDDGLKGGEIIGPSGFRQISGKPERQLVPASAKNSNDWAQLWDRSEELTGERFIV